MCMTSMIKTREIDIMEYAPPPLNIMQDLVAHAIDDLVSNDKYLLQHNLNERTITHRLAMYLQILFKDWDVDCEYNKNFDKYKKLVNYQTKRKVKINDPQGTTVFPDIIIHHRGTTINLLAIEVKKSTNQDPDDNDLRKLRALKDEIGYTYTLFIRLNVGPRKKWIKTLFWN